MLGSGSVLPEKRQQPPPQGGGGTKKHKAGCSCSCCEKLIAQGGGTKCEKLIAPGQKKPKYVDSDDIPYGALEEHRPQFEAIWLHYYTQIYETNAMDVDIYPGTAGNIDVTLVVWSKTTQQEINEIQDLAKVAIQKYNKEPSNAFAYKLLKIEKVNRRMTGYFEYFMTLKVLNLTLGTVVETFQVRVGADLFKRYQMRHGLDAPSEDDVMSCLPKGGALLEEEMAGSQSRQFSPDKKPNSAQELLDWQKKLPHRFLANEVLWDDNVFIPEDASKEHPAIFRTIYWRYFNQICETEGFDIDIYPGDSKAAVYIPYLDFEKEIDLLMDLANHAIQDYNNTGNNDYKYEVEYVEKVNLFLAECREFFMTVKVKILTLLTPVETFQIHAYKGPDMENVVRTCRRKFELKF